jgi:hypothetical protein
MKNQIIWQNQEVIKLTQIILNSYQKLLGKDLINRQVSEEEQAKNLFLSPFVVLAHGIQSDPIYTYGNQIALQLWERNGDELRKMPSRLSAEAILREDRQIIIETTQKQGFMANFQGIRISKTGKRYQIKDITLWNLMDEQDQYTGQAATFSQWELLN